MSKRKTREEMFLEFLEYIEKTNVLLDRIMEGDKSAEEEERRICEEWANTHPPIRLTELDIRKWQKVEELRQAIFDFMKSVPEINDYGFSEVSESICYECYILIEGVCLAGEIKKKLARCMELSEETFITLSYNGNKYLMHFLIGDIREIDCSKRG